MRFAVPESKLTAMVLESFECSADIDLARESNTGDIEALAAISVMVSKANTLYNFTKQYQHTGTLMANSQSPSQHA